MKIIYLIGFMGSGKTTTGKLLSEILQMNHYDTDRYIEKKYGLSIPAIFQVKGEATFRDYETAALHELDQRSVVSTGGGIVERTSNVHLMQSRGTVIYLATSFDVIMSRLGNDPSRPLWQTSSREREKRYCKRINMYEACAELTIHTDYLSPEGVVAEIVRQLNKRE